MDNPDYQATLDFLYRFLPMFQRVGAAAYKPDLKNTLALCAAIGNPEKKFKSIHVAGTNGKGSSSHMLAAILQRAGFRTGLYTSPHLKSFTERIKVNGLDVSQSFVVEFVAQIRPDLERIHPSFFEATVAMAFEYFAIEKVDVAVIETGLGGRLDSTNVIVPAVSLITNIGYDHKDLLGDTLSLIASEKAGIIKPRVPVVISEKQNETDAVFINKAAELNSQISFAGNRYRLTESASAAEGVYDVYRDERLMFKDLACELKGSYQKKNIPGVLMTVDKLREQHFTIPDEAIQDGISRVVSLTQLKGRWQKLSDKPLTICDTGHNEDGIREVIRQIKTLDYHALHIVFGTVKDKDIVNVLALLPSEANYYFCEAKIPRALPARELAVMAGKAGLKGEIVEDVNEAIARAKAHASPKDLIFIGGSTFVVAEIDNL